MKKILLIGIVLVLVVVGGGFAYLVMNANALVQKYKPDMEQQASDALGSDVTLGNISVSLFPSAKLVIDRVSIANAEIEGEALTFDNLILSIDLLPLLSRRLSINTLSIANANLTLLIEEDGIFIAGLPKDVPEQTGDSGDTEESSEAADIPVSIKLDSFKLINATVLVKDTIAGVEYDLNPLDVEASFALDGDIVSLPLMKGSATAMSKIDLVFSASRITYNMADASIAIGKMSAKSMGSEIVLAGVLDPNDSSKILKLTSAGIDLGKLTPFYDIFLPAGNDFGLQGIATPDIAIALGTEGRYSATGTLSIKNGSAGIEGLVIENLSGVIEVNANEKVSVLSGEGLTATLSGAPLTVRLGARADAESAALDPLHVDAFGGGADLITKLSLVDETMPFTTSLAIAGMDIAQLLPALSPDMPDNVTGTLQTVKGDIKGTLDENMMPSIVGTAEMALIDGLIKNVNLGKEVLGSIADIPFISGTLLQAVPESFRAFLEKDHTALESVTANFNIANEQMATENLAVVSDFFTLDATGTIGFDTRLDLDSQIHFNQEFSQGLVDRTAQLAALLDSEGRLTIPVKISGIPPELKVVPDVSKLLEGAIKGTIKEEGRKLLRGLLGDDESTGGGLLDRFRRKKN